MKVELSDDTELGNLILACIADNENYLVTNPRIKEWIFSLVKAKIKHESLVLTPTRIRLLALYRIKEDQTLTVKIGNLVVSSSNRARFMTRMIGASRIGRRCSSSFCCFSCHTIGNGELWI